MVHATLSNSDRLREKIELVRREQAAAVEAIRLHPRVRDVYPDYLITLHFMVRATEPLLRAAADRAQELAESDPVAAKIAPFLAGHIKEESNHDEWILEDLEALGIDRTAALNRLPRSSIAAMVGAQYYWIFHYHPVVLLGYMEVMEGYPPTEEYAADLMAATGFSRQAFRSLLRHGVLDPHHRDHINEVLDALSLTRDQEAAIGANALQTVRFASRALREVVTLDTAAWTRDPIWPPSRDSMPPAIVG